MNNRTGAKPGKRKPVQLRKYKAAPIPAGLDESADFVPDFSHLQQRTKLLRQNFCHEYIKDFNSGHALLRMGYKYARPYIRAGEWLREAYTQWYLSTLMEKMEEKAIVTRNTVLLGLLKEANYHGGLDASSASRISAFRALAKILGMEVTTVNGNITLTGGVMAVPMAGTLDEWEAASKKAQAQLKQAVWQ